MQIDLSGYDARQKSQGFRVKVQDHSLNGLIEDARNAGRVYELLMLNRPSMLWRYLWVQLVDVPERVWARYQQTRDQRAWYLRHTWPRRTLPLSTFDGFFCWNDDDLDATCWLQARTGDAFKQYGQQQMQRVVAAQSALHASDDLLIQQEIQAMAAGEHPYDYCSTACWRLGPLPEALTRPHRTPAYYQQLQGLLGRADVRSVMCRGTEDFPTLRWLCLEQRRRAKASGQGPMAALPLGLQADDAPVLAAWQAGVAYDPEGEGAGDLWIHQPPYPDDRRAWLHQQAGRSQWLLLDEDAGELAGYQRTVGEGWAVYAAQRPSGVSVQESAQRYQTLLQKYAASPRVSMFSGETGNYGKTAS